MNILKNFIIIICVGFVGLAQGQNLQKIACQGNIEKLDSLLKTGFDVNATNKRGLSLLHYAVACNKEKMVKLLIAKGINLNVMDKRKYTPLYFAAAYDRTNMVNLLIDAGAKPDQGHSPIFYAVLNDNLPILKKLVTPKINVDTANTRGNTPLAMAIRQGSLDIAEFLMAKGADKNKVRTYSFKGKYVGQTEPGLKPEVFALNFVSVENMTHSASFSPNGKEFYFTIESRKYHGGTIMVTRKKKGKWTTPKPACIEGTYT